MRRPATLTLLAALGLVLLVANATANDRPPHRFTSAQLSLSKVAGDGPIGLPQLRVYDQDGRQVMDAGTGFQAERFAEQLTKTLSEPKPNGAERTLDDELELVRTSDRKALATDDPPPFTIIKYSAEWCFPCRAQAKALKAVLADHSALQVTVIDIDVPLGADNMGVIEKRSN